MNPAMQSAYRQYPQGQGRSPAAARRPGPIPGGAHLQHTNAANQQHAQRQAQLELQLARRRARKPTDRNMPDGVEGNTIGDGVRQYKELREVERKLDSTMLRKKLDMADQTHRLGKKHKILRVWISNTVENQPWQEKGFDADAFDFGTGEDATYKVRIEGRLLDDETEDQLLDDEQDVEGDNTKSDAAPPSKTRPTKPKRFLHFFKSITVEPERTVPGDGLQVEWKRQPGNMDFDSLEFERKGDENMNISVSLFRAENPERYQLAPELAAILDTDEADKAEAVLGVWEYIKAMRLQEDEERRLVRCNERLKALFGGAEAVYFPYIPERLLPSFLPLEPIKLAYTIRVDSAYQSAPVPTVYDIRVIVDDPLHAQMVAMTQNPEFPATLRQIAFLDDQLAITIQALAHSKAKHAFYRSMQGDPVNFVKRWMSSQKRDLEVILGEATRGGGEDGGAPEFQRGGDQGIWGSQVVQEAVRYRLAKEATPRR